MPFEKDFIFFAAGRDSFSSSAKKYSSSQEL